jgi:uncharacterized protein (TIGR02271 family)
MTRAPLSQLDEWQLENQDQDIRGWQVLDAAGTVVGTVVELIVDTDSEYVDAIVLDTGATIPTSEIDLTNGVVYLRQAEVVEPVEPVAPVAAADEAVVPIVEEELRVGKRPVERGGIRIHKRVEEKPVSEQVTLRDETVEVQRRPVDRAVSEADLAAAQDGTFEVRERDEEAVVDKQARVVEEVVIDKDVEERTETVQDTLRRTDVDVEQVRDRQRGS